MTTKINIPSPCDGLIDYDKRIEETSLNLCNDKTKMNKMSKRCANQGLWTQGMWSNGVYYFCKSCSDKLMGKVKNNPNEFDYVTTTEKLLPIVMKKFRKKMIKKIMGKIK